MRIVIRSSTAFGAGFDSKDVVVSRSQIGYAGGFAPWNQVVVVEPTAEARKAIDPRMARVMDKQSLLLMVAAQSCVRNGSDLSGVAPEARGLFAAIPAVDDHIPVPAALEELRQTGRDSDAPLDLAILANNTHPLVGLTCLNSTAAAQVCIHLETRGTAGVFCQDGDAGLTAIIEAALSVENRENDLAFAMAVAPKISPYLFLQLEKAGYFRTEGKFPPLGEGAASLVLGGEGQPGTPRSSIAGYARGRCLSAEDAVEVRRELMLRALAMAGADKGEVGFVWADPICGGYGSGTEQRALEAVFGFDLEHRSVEFPSANSGAATGLFGCHRAARILGEIASGNDNRQAFGVVNASGLGGQMATVVVHYEA